MKKIKEIIALAVMSLALVACGGNNEEASKPTDNTVDTSDNGTKPSEDIVDPSDNGTKPSEDIVDPSETESNSNEEKYTVTFDTKGGSVIESQKIRRGVKLKSLVIQLSMDMFLQDGM